MPTIPPWLNTSPREFVQAAERGRALGQSAMAERNRVMLAEQSMGQRAQEEQQGIAMERARLESQERTHTMEIQARSEQEQRNFLANQQRNAILDAYHQTQTALAKRRLDDAAQEKARKYAAQQKLGQLVQRGVPFDQAMLQVPELMGAGAETQMMRSATSRPTKETMSEIDKKKYDRAEKELAALEKAGKTTTKTGIWPFRSEHPSEQAKNLRQTMEEIEKKYSAPGGATHRFDAKTGTIQPIQTNAEPAFEELRQ